MQRLLSHTTMVSWSPSATFLTPIRPLMNSNLTVSSVSLAAKAAILSNSSTDIWDVCTVRSAITVMVHPLSGCGQCGEPQTKRVPDHPVISRTSDHITSTRSPSSPRITKFGLRCGSAARASVGAFSSRAVMDAASSIRARGAPMQ